MDRTARTGTTPCNPLGTNSLSTFRSGGQRARITVRLTHLFATWPCILDTKGSSPRQNPLWGKIVLLGAVSADPIYLTMTVPYLLHPLLVRSQGWLLLRKGSFIRETWALGAVNVDPPNPIYQQMVMCIASVTSVEPYIRFKLDTVLNIFISDPRGG